MTYERHKPFQGRQPPYDIQQTKTHDTVKYTYHVNCVRHTCRKNNFVFVCAYTLYAATEMGRNY